MIITSICESTSKTGCHKAGRTWLYRIFLHSGDHRGQGLHWSLLVAAKTADFLLFSLLCYRVWVLPLGAVKDHTVHESRDLLLGAPLPRELPLREIWINGDLMHSLWVSAHGGSSNHLLWVVSKSKMTLLGINYSKSLLYKSLMVKQNCLWWIELLWTDYCYANPTPSSKISLYWNKIF